MLIRSTARYGAARYAQPLYTHAGPYSCNGGVHVRYHVDAASELGTATMGIEDLALLFQPAAELEGIAGATVLGTTLDS